MIEASTVSIRVEVDPVRTRPIDRPATIGSFTALYLATGWKPEIPIKQSVLDTLAYWRAELAQPGR
jgi:GDP-4-dehydro-6-deoxy-D-mannose reductase